MSLCKPIPYAMKINHRPKRLRKKNRKKRPILTYDFHPSGKLIHFQ